MRSSLGRHQVLLILVTTLLVGVLPLTAQRITGAISGQVIDAQGAAISNANVTVSNEATGYKLELKSNSEGRFEVPDLKPSTYKVTVEAAGFSKLSTSATVRVGVVTPVSARMEVGTTTTEVVVHGDAVTVDSTKATVQGVVTSDRIAALPLNGRNFLDLAQQEPGVQTIDGGDFDPTKNQMTGVSVGGRSGRVTRIQVDGVDITDETVGSTVINISNESIQEFGISQASLDPATDLTSSGAVNIITKSGTNQIHGDGLVNFRDARWAADQRLDKCDPVALAASGVCNLSDKPPFDRQIYAGQVGFPFWKNKIFGHISYEQNNTDSQRFTAVTEFPSFNGSFGSPMDERMASGRIDWNITDRMRAFYRYNYNYNNGVTGYGARDLAAYSNLNNTNTNVAGLDISSPTWTHGIRFSYLNFNNFIVDANAQAGTPTTLDPGGKPILVRITGRLQDVGPDLLAPQSTFQDNKTFKYDGAKILRNHTLRFGAEYNRIIEAGIFNFFGNAPRIRASYTASSIAFANTNPFGPGGADNPLNFPLNQIVFGNGLGAGSEKPALGFPSGGFYNNRVAFYGEDSWKLRSNFTLTGGVRWNYNDGLSNGDLERVPLIGAFDPTLAGKPNVPKNNFAPQLGFAWDVKGSGKTVVRGGVGIFYETNIFNNISYDRALNLPPGLGNDTPVINAGAPNLIDPGTGATLVDFTNDFGKSLGSVIDKVVAAQQQYQSVVAALAAHWPPPGTPPLFNQLGGTGGNDLVDTRYRTPYSVMFNIGVQREIANGLVLSVDYIRNRGVGFNIIRDRNRLGAADTLDTGIAISSINAAFDDNGCGTGLTPGTAAWNTAVTCMVDSGLGIADFADYGLDAGSALDGYAFRGKNPNYRDMQVIENNGLSLYQALQVRLTGRLRDWGPFKNTSTNITYALGRFSATGVDQDFLSTSAYNDTPTKFFGPANLDRTHIVGVTFITDVPLGFKIATTNTIKSALATSMFLPDGSPSGSGEIFFTDLDGDGVTEDPLPGTNRGAFSRSVKAGQVNKAIDNFNNNVAGGFTPAAKALVTAGLFTEAQLTALGATIPTIPNAPSDQRGNPNFVNTDVRISRPVKIGERFVIEPQLEVFNLFNIGNYTSMATSLLDGGPGSPNGTSRSFIPTESGLSRVGSGSGSFAPGTMRALQFNIKVTF